MNNLKSKIDELTKFGVKPNLEVDNKLRRLKTLLVDIYSHYLKVSFEFDENKYKKAPSVEYNEIREVVDKNFPELGFYHSIFDSQHISQDADVFMGDSIDDLSDIIKDMLGVKWRFENTSENDALWYFEFHMRAHSEQHLVDLLKYLKDLEG